MASTATACSGLSGGPLERNSEAAASGNSCGVSAEETKPRITSARMGERQSAKRSPRMAAVTPGASRKASSNWRWRRRAAELVRRERGETGIACIPTLGERLRRGAVAGLLRQRRAHHLADGMVVVLRGELEQFQDAGIDHRFGIEHFEQRLEFFGGQFRARGQRMHHADQALATERHAHAHTGTRFELRVECRQVIEESSQRCIERDAHNGARQGRASKVFHSACG